MLSNRYFNESAVTVPAFGGGGGYGRRGCWVDDIRIYTISRSTHRWQITSDELAVAGGGGGGVGAQVPLSLFDV